MLHHCRAHELHPELQHGGGGDNDGGKGLQEGLG